MARIVGKSIKKFWNIRNAQRVNPALRCIRTIDYEAKWGHELSDSSPSPRRSTRHVYLQTHDLYNGTTNPALAQDLPQIHDNVGKALCSLLTSRLYKSEVSF
jgi:hypothetical protein